MAHLEKYHKAQVNNLFRHYEREHITENVNEEKTHLNYNLHNINNEKGINLLKERLNNVHCLKRKNVNVMCSWIITAPKTLEEKYHKQFFNECYDFLKKRYGDINTIGAYVHMDEQQPHLHYVFVPVTHDKKKNIDKVSAKEVITLKELRTFHNNLKEHLENKMNMQVDILNNATINGNKTIVELKRESAIKEIEVIEHIQNIKRESAYNKIQHFEELTKDAEKNLNTKQTELKELKEQIQTQENKLNSILKDIEKTHINNNIYFNNNQIDHLKKNSILKEKKNFITKKETVLIDKNTYDKMCEDLKELYADNKRCNVLLDALGNNMLENEDLKEEVKELKQELQQEKAKSFNRLLDNNTLKIKLDKIYKKYPSIKQELNQEKKISKERKI